MKKFIEYTLMFLILGSIGTVVVTVFGLIWITDPELSMLTIRICLTSIATFFISGVTLSNID
tara:strand:+ start:295 stop:480 length:186 start_codon:yes stop_codon:yes gene_type:complete